MQSIENLTLEWAILHRADSALASPALSSEPVELDEGLRAYFEDHIRACARSGQLQMGKFLSSSATVADACKRYGFRFCDRLQIRLFGNTRGT